MKHEALFWFAFLAIAVVWSLAGCGKQLNVTQGDVLSFKTLAECRCPAGQFIQTITTKELMNGDIVAYDVFCVKVANQ